MRVYTVHGADADAGEPVLVREGLAWAGLVLGGLWLLAHRAWVAGLLSLAALLALLASPLPGAVRAVLLAAYALAHLLFGHDLRRAALAAGGRPAIGVVAAADRDAARLRLAR